MKKLALIFVLLAGAVLAHSQNTTTSGTITLQAASCAGASAGYVYYILPTNTSAVAVTISGTWSATLQFVGSVNGTTWTSVNATPIPTASAVTSTTANGTWTINPAGLAEVCVYASSYASGKAVINASVSTASTAANGSAGGDLSGSYPNPTVVALNGSPLPANSFGALTNSGTGTLSYVPPFAVDITQAPYNAKCDGSTDDHVAIQAALDANAAITIPTGPSAPTQCNLGTVGITLCSVSNPFNYNAIYANGGYFGYTGAGAIITFNECNSALVRDLSVDGTGSTGTPTVFSAISNAQNIELTNIEDATFPGSFTSINDAAYSGLLVNNYIGEGDLIVGSSSLIVNASVFQNFSMLDTGAVAISATYFGGTATITDSTSVNLAGDDFNDTMSITSNGGYTGVNFTNSTIGVSLTTSGAGTVFLDGSIAFAGSLSITGAWQGSLNGIDSTTKLWTFKNGLNTSILYSVAGTPLPTCNSGLSGTQLQVSDALVPTFLGTYTGSSTVHSPVICNGTNWVTY